MSAELIRSSQAREEYLRWHPNARFLGLREYWRIETGDQFDQDPDKSRVYAVPDGEPENMRDLLVELLINPHAKMSSDGSYIRYGLHHILAEVEEGLRRLGYLVTTENGDPYNGRLLPRSPSAVQRSAT